MIRWLMLGLLLLLFTESACDRDKNAISDKNGKSKGSGGGDGGGNGVDVKIKATASTNHEDLYNNRLTCYTCVNVSDNKMCNEWAIDTPCPVGGQDFCRSLHIVDSRGQSVLVNKSCASKVECSPASVGCMPIDTQKICISCCDTSYCNVDSPTNSSNATYSRKRPYWSDNKSNHSVERPRLLDHDHPKLNSSARTSIYRQHQLAALAFFAISLFPAVFLNRTYHT